MMALRMASLPSSRFGPQPPMVMPGEAASPACPHDRVDLGGRDLDLACPSPPRTFPPRVGVGLALAGRPPRPIRLPCRSRTSCPSSRALHAAVVGERSHSKLQCGHPRRQCGSVTTVFASVNSPEPRGRGRGWAPPSRLVFNAFVQTRSSRRAASCSARIPTTGMGSDRDAVLGGCVLNKIMREVRGACAASAGSEQELEFQPVRAVHPTGGQPRHLRVDADLPPLHDDSIFLRATA
jgi:hypothetical protein